MLHKPLPAHAAFQIRLLGPLEITLRGGQSLPRLRTRKGYWLLALLVLRQGKEVSREWLAETLWSESLPQDAARSLRQSLTDLRKALGNQEFRLQSPTPRTLRLDLTDAFIDLNAFDAAISDKSPASWEAATGYYQGALLEGCSELWVYPERERREQDYLEALQGLADAALTQGEAGRAVGWLRQAVTVSPSNEGLVRALMEALQGSGDRNAAVEVYRGLVRQLQSDAVRQVPEGTTRGLYEQIVTAARQEGGGRLRQSVRSEPSPALQGKKEAAQERGASAQGPCEERVREELLEELLLEQPTGSSWKDSSGARSTGRMQVTSTQAVRAPFRARNLLMMVGLASLLLAIGFLAGFRGVTAPSPYPLPGPKALWVQRYLPIPNETENCEPTATTTDSAGNVYITGFVQSTSGNVDYLTLKYNSEGRLLWHAHYRGPGHYMDRARSIAVDGAGNVYVTGESDNGKGNGTTPLSGLDWATIKYDADGDQLWVARYNGPDNGEDRPVKVCVDRSGSVFVAGFSRHRCSVAGHDPSAHDFVTVKYHSDGRQAWAHHIRASDSYLSAVAVDMALDTEGNVYVIGDIHDLSPVTFAKNDILTVKYSGVGTELWRRLYRGKGVGSVSSSCLAVDASGNVTVAGRQFNGELENNGTLDDILTLRYNNAGDLMWVRTEDCSQQIDYARALVEDAFGNTYVTGTTETNGGDYVMLKYSRNGALVWKQLEKGIVDEGNVHPQVFGMDHAGNLLVTGYAEHGTPAQGAGTDYDYVTLKYDPNGRVLWKGTYSANSGHDRALLLTVDQNDCVLVTGKSDGGRSITTVKYAN